MDLKRLWGTTALSLFALLSFAGVLIVQNHCRNSSFVHWVDVHRHLSLSSAGSVPSFEDQGGFRQHQYAIEEVQSFFQSMDFSAFPIKISIEREEDDLLKVSSSEIKVGSKWLGESSQIQRAVVKAWVLHYFDSSIQSNKIQLEILTDIITQLVRGHSAMLDPIKNVELNIWDVDNLEVLRSVLGVCDTPWRPAEEASPCRHLGLEEGLGSGLNSKVEDLKEISIWSLRPMVDHVLIRTFDDMPWTKRTGMVRKWLVAMRNKKWPTETQLSFKSVQKFFDLGNRSLKELDTPDLNLPSAIEIPPLDLVVLDETKSVPAAFSSQRLRMMYVSGDHVYYSKNKDSLKLFEDVFYWSSKKFIWAACQMPQLGDLSKAKPSDFRILYVRKCAGDTLTKDKILYSSYAGLGEPGFAIQNPSATFALFNVPSVQLSFKWGLKVSDRLDFIKASFQNRSKLFGWNAPIFLEEYNSYQIKAALPVVEYFRAPSLNLVIGK